MSKDRRIHLICNAHIDPMWLWQWEEGAAEAVSTFRIAADFCEQYEGFIFNHNEALLYKWVEEYEPELFKRIQRLVAEGKWHIMGGWYLQPDCNMPSGESFIRQILAGRAYFKEKFGVVPTTAVNFDPFGHSRGLAQILAKSGYDSYIYCKPKLADSKVPGAEFIWEGFDGSRVRCLFGFDYYFSRRGEAADKVHRWMELDGGSNDGLILWGIGNHGGGPSRQDIEMLARLMEETAGYEILHSTPEAYFEETKEKWDSLPVHRGDINSYAVGCYTSQSKVKQLHRRLENEIYMTEKMLSAASMNCLMKYPHEEIRQAINDLLLSEFHDMLPGSSVQPTEEDGIRLMYHGLEIASGLKMKSFMALAAGQRKAEEGEIPILVYNPHPFKVNTIVECEFQLPDQNWKNEFSMPLVYRNGEPVPCQAEKEHSNLNLDWRKRVVFLAELEPSSMNRFDCRIKVLPEKPRPLLKVEDNKIRFETQRLEVEINAATGLIDKYAVDGVDYLLPGALCPVVMKDSDDAWELREKSFRNIEAMFSAMPPVRAAEFAGIRDGGITPVRVIEDGEVRTVVEALLSYNNSFICQRYMLPKHGTEIQVETRVYWNEKGKMLKLFLPTPMKKGKYLGQTAFGVAELSCDGSEVVAQKWVSVADNTGDMALTCINDGIYGSDFKNGEIRLSLLRSPGYAAHPILDRPVMPKDRFSPHIDQGERVFRLWIKGGRPEERLRSIEREAIVCNEKPFALTFCPSGKGPALQPAVILKDDSIQMTAFKKAEKDNSYIIRLYEPTGKDGSTVLCIPAINLEEKIPMGAFEVKTLKVDMAAGTIAETDITEGILHNP